MNLDGLHLFSRPEDRSLGFCSRETIVLNAWWFARPRQFFTDGVAEARATRPPDLPIWHGGVGGVEGEYERLLTHEFGHLVAASTRGSEEFARRGFEAAKADPSIAVSGYSLKDPLEWFAEVFDAMRMGGEGEQVDAMRGFLA